MPDLLTTLAADHPDVEVWAAGGVLHRPGDDGVEILLVHRPQYDDWSLPKGKVDRGETLRRAAAREVEEETGLTCAVGRRLGLVRYVDTKGRPKGVVYWLMTPETGRFEPNREVDRVQWLPLAAASLRCTYAHDRDLLARRVRRALGDGNGPLR